MIVNRVQHHAELLLQVADFEIIKSKMTIPRNVLQNLRSCDHRVRCDCKFYFFF